MPDDCPSHRGARSRAVESVCAMAELDDGVPGLGKIADLFQRASTNRHRYPQCKRCYAHSVVSLKIPYPEMRSQVCVSVR